MSCKNVLVLMMVVLSCQTGWASLASEYLITGRAEMLSGTQSGLRQAYQTFDNALKDASCTDCNINRELRFLHAATRTAMLGIRDDGGSMDSVMELARAFGVNVIGDSLDPNKLETSLNLDEHDLYKIPADAPDASGIRNFIDTAMIPQIDAILAELELIGDSSGNRFRMYFEPSETGLLTRLEVDYGEVLALKGILKAAKAQLRAKAAYDTAVGEDEKLMEKLYGKCLSMQDLLDRYPELLKVGPTSGYNEDGRAAMAQARQDWIDDCQSFLAVLNYISGEDTPQGNDPQTDELLYIDPNDNNIVDDIKQKLNTMLHSLQNDAAGTYITETTDTYMLAGIEAIYKMELTTGFFDEFEKGNLTLISGSGAPLSWKIDWLDRNGSNLLAGLSSYANGWLFGTFSANIDNDGVITNGTIEFWGLYSGAVTGLAASPTESDKTRQFDLNPLLGSSARYPWPVNLRDLLPYFDNWNAPLPGTMGHGLNNNPALGGITPGMTQKDWQIALRSQPAGTVVIDEIAQWQKNSMGFVGVWQTDQKVFADIGGDTKNPSDQVQLTDIKSLYMGYDYDLYGSIVFYNNAFSNGMSSSYDIYLSYSDNDKAALGSIRLHIEIYGQWWAYGRAEQKISDYGNSYWQYLGDFSGELNNNAINFRVPFWQLPGFLFGRFISIDSYGRSEISNESDREENSTHLQIGGFGPIPPTGPVDELGFISGIIDYDNYQGAPIFVQAYTDYEDPEASIVASTIIMEPGAYVLDGIGLGWSGYVRAFTPLFGFNMFDNRGLLIKSDVEVYAVEPYIDYVDMALLDPVIVQLNTFYPDTLVTGSGQENMYAFDAVAGAMYLLKLDVNSYLPIQMSLLGRNGHDEITSTYLHIIMWRCPAGGRYFIRIGPNYFDAYTCNYTLSMSRCPAGDIGGPAGFGAADCRNDFYDLQMLISQWLNACGEPDWCANADFDKNELVNVKDLAIFAQEWQTILN